jgi:hypothetical protein
MGQEPKINNASNFAKGNDLISLFADQRFFFSPAYILDTIGIPPLRVGMTRIEFSAPSETMPRRLVLRQGTL